MHAQARPIQAATALPPRAPTAEDLESPSACPRCGTTASNLWFPGTGICVPCRTQDTQARVDRENYERLGHEIAFEDSCARLARLAPRTGDGWFDTGLAMLVPGRESSNLARALAYLRSRGALEIHPDDKELVRHRQVKA